MLLALACAFVSSCVAGSNHKDTGHEKANPNGSYNDPTTSRALSQKQFDEQVEVSNYITVAGLTLYVWEYLRTLHRELYMYQWHMIKRPQVLLFLLIRYGTIPALILPAYALWHHFSNNEDCPKKEQVTVAVVQFFVACIFSWRTIAIWRRKRWVILFLVSFSLLQFAASVALLYHSHDAVTLTGACRPSSDDDDDGDDDNSTDMGPPGVNTVKWFYLISMIFDTATMVLSLYKLLYYANMGRKLDQPMFSDPFEEHRRQLEKPPTTETGQTSRRPSAAETLKRMQGRVGSIATFPYRSVLRVMRWWSTLTPLLARLIANGLVYFFVATAFNVVNFVLEQVKSIHAKSFLTLYPPLMCVLCQNMILTEFDAVWSSHNPDFDIPGRQFVDRVVGARDDRRARMSELDRFEEFVTGLEERYNTSQSSHARIPNGTPPRSAPSLHFPPVLTDKQRPSQVSFPPRHGRPSVTTSELSPGESPRRHRLSVATSELSPHATPRTSVACTVLSSSNGSPQGTDDLPAPLGDANPSPRTTAFGMAPDAPGAPPLPEGTASPPPDYVPQLSATQQHQALRMAGLR